MFRWYKNAEICYVHLEDINASVLEGMPVDTKLLSHYRIDSLALITGVEQAYLTGADLSKASIAKRMYWAAGRVTTKVEDMAYSLLGLFDINMPLLYGEGAKAFTRLQEEILKETDDQSLFAWEPKLTHSGQVQHLRKVTLSEGIPVFARHPAEFLVSHDMEPCVSSGEMAMVGGKGLKIELPLFKTIRNADIQSPLRIAVLDWTKWRKGSMHDRIGIVLHKICSGHFMRHPTAPLTRVRAKDIDTRDLRTVFIRKVINDKVPSPSNSYLPHFNQKATRNRRLVVTSYLPQTWPQHTYLRNVTGTPEGDKSAK
ncbi:hypothetical protein N0V91_008011 [Didymella pomorum]|uniref:DUF8212 domain-containing protein n=1 Tax=Didymella pomorum TaxID=749634 RepID=A0A9W8Z9S9_9PLEO|nr:hypothetical protein N0V91_008011 [Didymella pomorum]